MGMGQGQTRGCSWKIEPTFSKGASDILRTVKQKTVKLARRQVTEAAEKVTQIKTTHAALYYKIISETKASRAPDCARD